MADRGFAMSRDPQVGFYLTGAAGVLVLVTGLVIWLMVKDDRRW